MKLQELSKTRCLTSSIAQLTASGFGAALRKPGCHSLWGDPVGKQNLGHPQSSAAPRPSPLCGVPLYCPLEGLSWGELKEPKFPAGSPRSTASLPHCLLRGFGCLQASAGTSSPAPSPHHTQDGHHDVTPQDLDGAPGDEVEGSEQVPCVHQRVAWRGVCRLEFHGQGPQAALGGPSEGLAVLQQRAVQMQADVGLQALRKALQHLGAGGSAQHHHSPTQRSKEGHQDPVWGEDLGAHSASTPSF